MFTVEMDVDHYESNFSVCLYVCVSMTVVCVFLFQAEDGIRDLVRSRGLGDVYKRQGKKLPKACANTASNRWSLLLK